MNLRNRMLAILSRDPDHRRRCWMLGYSDLQVVHRVALVAIRGSLTEDDRALIRVLFSLYRPIGEPDIKR